MTNLCETLEKKEREERVGLLYKQEVAGDPHDSGTGTRRAGNRRTVTDVFVSTSGPEERRDLSPSRRPTTGLTGTRISDSILNSRHEKGVGVTLIFL